MGLTGVWETGPDAGASFDLVFGRHLLGRAHTATLRCDDQALLPHHALVEVGDDATARLTQLTGRVPIRVNGQAIDGVAELIDRAVVELGASTFVISEGGAANAQLAAHVYDGAVVRAPRTIPSWQACELTAPGDAPVRDASSGGLVPAALGLAGSGAIALVLGQPMFLLFGALGAAVAIGSWVAQRVAAVRKFRSVAAEFEHAQAMHVQDLTRERQAWRRHQLAAVPTVHRAVHTLVERDSSLWTRRAAHPDAYLVAIGMTPGESDLPVAADLGAGCRLALVGPFSGAVARSLIVQLAASCGPADLRITVVTDRPERWDSVRNLPHVALPNGSVAIVAEAGLSAVFDDLAGHDAHGGHHLLITDQPGLLATRTSPLRRAIGDAQRDALVVVLPAYETTTDAAVPHICNSVLTTTAGPLARWVPEVHRTMLPQHVVLVGVGDRTTARCAAAIRGLVDPEDPLSVASAVPRQLSLAGLLQRDGTAALTPAAIAATWAAAVADPAPRTAIGMAADGVVDVDLVRDGPHGLIAGTTGAGKSELMRSLVAGMAAATSPRHLTFILIDYKGGATFDACAALPHVVGMVTDLDDQLADRALRSLQAELRRREEVLREHGVADLAELCVQAPTVTLPRLVVVIDEFAALVAEQPTFLHALVGVAQRGRSLGVHLLLATQRPSGVITDDIRANTNLRLALRLQDTADAIDVVGIVAPAHLPRGLPGRAVLRLGNDEHLTFQTAQCTAPRADGSYTELVVLVRAICEAARLIEVPLPTPPWQPPLPAVLTRDDLPSLAVDAIGLVDEPDLQRTTPLQWSPADGHLAIAGSPGSGVTSTLLTLCGATFTSRSETDVYVVDARGDTRWDAVAAHSNCVAVVRLDENERLLRLLHRLQAQVHEQRRGARTIVMIVDGLDALRRSLDDLSTATEFEALEEVLAAAEAGGITIVAGAELVAALPTAFLSRCAARWALHLNDAHDAVLLGIASRSVPPVIPGRIAIAGCGLTAQLIAPHWLPLPESATSRTATGAQPISAISSHVVADQLPKSHAVDNSTSLCVGIDFNTGEPFSLKVPDGEHLLLVGNARSGRSMGLARIAVAWSQAHPGGWVGAILPRRSTFPLHLAARSARDSTAIAALLDELTAHLMRGTDAPALLVVDDAEVVDDANARLASLATRGSGLCIAAAGRPDALRQSYGHWTGVLRRSRLGMVASGGADLDGDLLSTLLPRRLPIPARSGLWWVADNGPVRLMQMAVDSVEREGCSVR